MNTKKFIQILAVSATALITACEEELTSFDCETPITVTSQVSETTRAGYESSNYQNLPSKFVMDIYQGGGSYDYSLVEMTRQPNSNTYTAPNGTLLLWKGTNHSGASVKALTIPNDGQSPIDPTNAMTIRVRTNQTTDDNVKASDLLGAKTGDGITINGDAINIEFRHLMSKLYVNYTFADGLTSKSPQVNSITLKNTCVKGGYSYKDMNYVNSSLGYGDIQMYHNSTDKATEAIFYPYTPTSNPQLEVSIRINGVDKTLTCPIQFKDNNNSFEGGKKYIMNIRINGTTIDNTSIIVVKDWTEDNESIETIADKKILWIGTSIPSNHRDFGGRDSYPTMIAKATGCTIINKAVAGSLAIFFPEYTTWTADQWVSPTDTNDFKVNEAEAYALSATKEEIETKYTQVLTNLAKTKFPRWNSSTSQNRQYQTYINAIPSHIARLQRYSYEELILPHINGTEGKEQCDVVVIDHGYNDMNYIPNEVIWGHAEGLAWLHNIPNMYESPDDIEIAQVYSDWCATEGYGDGPKISYISAMNYIIKECKEACKKANRNVQIIIGNNYASRTVYYKDNSIYNYVGTNLVADGGLYHRGYFGDHLVKANEAIAAINGLPIVNVYKHTGLDATNANMSIFDQMFFELCPDGVHPGSDPNGKLNKIIADIYIEEFKKIFGK